MKIEKLDTNRDTEILDALDEHGLILDKINELIKVVNWLKDLHPHYETPHDTGITPDKIVRTANNEIIAITYEGKQYYPKELHPAIGGDLKRVEGVNICTHCGFEFKFHKCNPHNNSLTQ